MVTPLQSWGWGLLWFWHKHVSDVVRDLTDVPVVVGDRGQNTGRVGVLDVRAVGDGLAQKVREAATHSVENGLRGARVPLLAALAGKDVGVHLALNQQQHLLQINANWISDSTLPTDLTHLLINEGMGSEDSTLLILFTY